MFTCKIYVKNNNLLIIKKIIILVKPHNHSCNTWNNIYISK